MSTYRVGALLVVTIALFLAACSAAAGEVTASLGEESMLKVGQGVAIQGQDLKVKFQEVVQDSRCPMDVICVWQGEASMLVEITYRESVHPVVLTQSGMAGELTTKEFNEYTLAFRLEPYPDSARQIPAKDYRLVLAVTKR